MSVTPEEQAAIDRLEALGFERALCIGFPRLRSHEALAANYLLKRGGLKALKSGKSGL